MVRLKPYLISIAVMLLAILAVWHAAGSPGEAVSIIIGVVAGTLALATVLEG